MRVSNCFLDCNGKFLVVSRLNPRTNEYEWDLPAAIANTDETTEAAAVRVMLEETGHKTESQDLKLLGTFEFISGGGKPYTMFTYQLKLQDPFKANGSLKSEWISVEECLSRQNLINNLRQLLVLTGYSK